jgi:hypothetical protein
MYQYFSFKKAMHFIQLITLIAHVPFKISSGFCKYQALLSTVCSDHLALHVSLDVTAAFLALNACFVISYPLVPFADISQGPLEK